MYSNDPQAASKIYSVVFSLVVTFFADTNQPPRYSENAQYYSPAGSDPSLELSHGFAGLSVQDPIARSQSAMSMQSRDSRPHPSQFAHPPQGDPYAQSRYNSMDSYNPNHGHYPQQQWAPTNHSTGYDPLYAAASDILGMGPPSMRPPPPMGPPHHTMGHPPPNPAGPYMHAAPAPAPPPGQIYPDTASIASYSDTHTSPSIIESYTTSPSDYQEFELRGPVQKAVPAPSSAGKSIDLNATPFTKEYIDQYRHRIKADPDPESHFLYAKYLVEAAKKFRSAAKDSRAGKKYSEFLITEALKVVRRLATQGAAYDEAQFFLANCYGTGALGLQVDHEKAYHLYLQAAKQNHAAACYRVAVCNEIGAGTKREAPRAAAFYRKAASLGDTAAMYKVGMILLHGLLGEPRNPREAVGWLKRAGEQADEENPHALHELALLYEQPNSNLVPHDPAHAKQLYTQAAQLGYTPSQFKLGQCYEYGSVCCPVDPRRSIAWYTKAAEKGDAEAELALSGWYLTGSEGVLKQSDSEAYLWARRAANKGLSKAEYAVGYYAEVGIGIKQDIEFAKRWYMRAAGTSSECVSGSNVY
jgi:uncharacterized protein